MQSFSLEISQILEFFAILALFHPGTHYERTVCCSWLTDAPFNTCFQPPTFTKYFPRVSGVITPLRPFGLKAEGSEWFFHEIQNFTMFETWGHQLFEKLPQNTTALHQDTMGFKILTLFHPLDVYWKQLKDKVTYMRHFFTRFPAIRPPQFLIIFFSKNLDLPFWGQIIDQLSPNLYHRCIYLATFIFEKPNIFESPGSPVPCFLFYT